MTKLTTLKFDLLKTKYFNKFCLCKEIERLHSNKIPSMARCGYLLGWSKVSFAFAITSYRKTWISFLANPIYLEAKKKKKKKKWRSWFLSFKRLHLTEEDKAMIYLWFFLMHGCLCRYEILWERRTQGSTPCLWEEGQKDYALQKRSLILFSAYHKSRSLKTASV